MQWKEAKCAATARPFRFRTLVYDVFCCKAREPPAAVQRWAIAVILRKGQAVPAKAKSRPRQRPTRWAAIDFLAGENIFLRFTAFDVSKAAKKSFGYRGWKLCNDCEGENCFNYASRCYSIPNLLRRSVRFSLFNWTASHTSRVCPRNEVLMNC